MKRILLSVFAAAITAAWAIPASAADVTIGGQYRLRGEYRNNADFDKTRADHSDSWGQRVRLTANAKATDDTSVKITLQDTRTWGSATSAAGGPNLTDDGTSNVTDLHESYVNIENLFGAPVALKAGRQELVYGDERLIGSFGWSNNGRSFDALKLVYKSDMVNVDVFTAKVREATTATVSGNGNDQDFYGIYASTNAVPNNTIDAYVLLLRDGRSGTGQGAFGFTTLGNTAIANTNDTQKLYTYGLRVKGAAVGLDYTVELPIQKGTIDTPTQSYDISAYAFAAKVGYTLPTPIKVRVGAEYDYASGDDDATNSEIGTFFNLFPTNHDKLGYMDQQGWRNVKAWNINASVEPTEKLKVLLSYWDFSLAEKQDAWYSASNWNNTPTNSATERHGVVAGNGSSDIGNEIDLVASYKYNNSTAFELGYSRFLTGKFIENQVTSTQQKKDQDWAYLMLTANF